MEKDSIPVSTVTFLPECSTHVRRAAICLFGQTLDGIQHIFVRTPGSEGTCEAMKAELGKHPGAEALFIEPEGLDAALKGSHVFEYRFGDIMEPDTIAKLYDLAVREDSDAVTSGFCRVHADWIEDLSGTPSPRLMVKRALFGRNVPATDIPVLGGHPVYIPDDNMVPADGKSFREKFRDWKWFLKRAYYKPDVRSHILYRLAHPVHEKNPDPQILLCCIGKRENRYAAEFVQWYRRLGFSAMVIYDNNDPDGERFEDVLAPDIADGFVTLIDFRGRLNAQLPAYEDCYRRFGAQYDWIAFFDMDEFLEIDGYANAGEYFSSRLFRRYDMVHVSWLNHIDSGHISFEDIPVRERFPESAPGVDWHIKSVVRGGIPHISWEKNPHTPFPNALRCANGSGRRCRSLSHLTREDLSVSRIHHYQWKSTEEFMWKILRGYPDHQVSVYDVYIHIRDYFSLNRWTEEKASVLVDGLLQGGKSDVDMREYAYFLKVFFLTWQI